MYYYIVAILMVAIIVFLNQLGTSSLFSRQAKQCEVMIFIIAFVLMLGSMSMTILTEFPN